MASSENICILWFRNDLRVRDNELLHHDALLSVSRVIPLYCFDDRFLTKKGAFGERKCEAIRAKFLLESISEFKASLSRLGTELQCFHAKPEIVIPRIVQSCRMKATVVFQAEDTYEEKCIEKSLIKEVESRGGTICQITGLTLFHLDDLKWKSDSPTVEWGRFRKIISKIDVREEFDIPESLPGRSLAPSKLPTIEELGYTKSDVQNASNASEFSEINFKGGESMGLQRLEDYIEKGLKTYKFTRNQLHGSYHSSHLSPWLANGCISPRTVYWQIRKYEEIHGDSQHTFKFIFELWWRDFFRLFCISAGNKVFYLTGPANRTKPWKNDPDLFSRWKSGKTGMPLVDAIMRQLLHTGFIPNRARYIVASFLIHAYGLDWRFGAEWFESILIDHDVCSNYGNWCFLAGVAGGTPWGKPSRTAAKTAAGSSWDKGEDSVFDPIEQGRHYDKHGNYIRQWVTECRSVKSNFIHEPWRMSKQQQIGAGCVLGRDYPLFRPKKRRNNVKKSKQKKKKRYNTAERRLNRFGTRI